MESAISSAVSTGHEGAYLDLDRQVIYEELAHLSQGSALFRFLLSLDQVDHWAIDHDDKADEEALVAYLKEVEDVFSSYYPVLHQFSEDLSGVLSHLTTTRCIYLLRYLAARNETFMPWFSMMLLRDFENSADVAAIVKRLEALDRAALLSEIFSRDRLQSILRILRGTRRV